MNAIQTTRHPAAVRNVRRAGALALLLGGLLQFGAARAADVTVVVSNIKSTGGMIRVGVFKDATTFPKVDQVLVGKAVAATTGKVELVFPGLAPGDYAVSAFHDLDDNGKLNRNLFGVPSEPYGFSRNARSNSGPPSFDDAKVTIGAAGARITTKLE